MDSFTLARELRALFIWQLKSIPDSLDPALVPIKALVADACITLARGNDSIYPSANENRVQFLGVEHEVDDGTIDKIIRCFEADGINRFFFWLSPSPRSAKIEASLLLRGFELFQGTGYPTLFRSTADAPVVETEFTIRRVNPDEIADFISMIWEIYGQRGDKSIFLRTCDVDGFHHFMAFENKRPIAASLLIVHNRCAYLGYAATLAKYRKRGAQSAMISARLKHAASLGCEWAASETLYMLQNSLKNLQRSGFQISYEKKVYVCTLRHT